MKNDHRGEIYCVTYIFFLVQIRMRRKKNIRNIIFSKKNVINYWQKKVNERDGRQFVFQLYYQRYEMNKYVYEKKK
jgi:hypothetical protein